MSVQNKNKKPSDSRARAVESSVVWGRLAGALGAVLLFTVPLTWWLSGEAGPFVWGKLLLATLLLAFYFSTNLDIVNRVAGARSTGLMVLTVASVVFVTIAVGAANYFAYSNPIEWDVTSAGLYTLTEQTEKVLGRLDKDVKLYAFIESTDASHVGVEETFSRYAEFSPRLSYAMVSPESRPDLIERYAITESGPRIVVTAGDREAKVKFLGEQDLTNAIIKVAEHSEKTIAVLTGHGELDFEDERNAEGAKIIADMIRAEGYLLKPLSLLSLGAPAKKGDAVQLNPATPADPAAPQAHHDGHEHGHGKPTNANDGPELEIPVKTNVLVIAGPQARLSEPELSAVDRYLNRGGRVILMLEPNITSGLEALVAPWKVDVRDDFVVDTNPMTRLMGLGAASPLVGPVGPHPITDSLVSQVVLVTSRSVDVAPGGEAGVNTRAILTAGDTAWGETQYADGSAALGDEDTPAPARTAVLASRSTNTIDASLTPEGRLLVIGDSDFINNRNHSLQGNADFILNAVNYLAEEEERIAIRPKTRNESTITLTGEQIAGLRIVSMDLLPALLIALGFGIVTVRRRR